ncbi:MAG TPA: hypothetical protein VNS29_15340 [Burkholderiaceae bacterium]|nr:hypothetical protein [Burkholderiaceae bacterium]
MLIDMIIDVDLGVGKHWGLQVPGIEAVACGELALIVEIDYDAGCPDEIWGTAPGEASPGSPEDFEVLSVRPYEPIKLTDGEDNVVLIIQPKADIRNWLAPDQMRAIENQIMKERVTC